MFLVCAGPSSQQAILLPRVAGAEAKLSSDAVNRMPGAHLIFTSNRRDSFGRWLVVLTHTLPDTRNNNHVCCQLLRMEACWRLLPSQRCGGEHSTRYSYTPTSSPKGYPQDCPPNCVLYFTDGSQTQIGSRYQYMSNRGCNDSRRLFRCQPTSPRLSPSATKLGFRPRGSLDVTHVTES
jgi:hypothetical protein